MAMLSRFPNKTVAGSGNRGPAPPVAETADAAMGMAWVASGSSCSATV